jgi:hypothetical protein
MKWTLLVAVAYAPAMLLPAISPAGGDSDPWLMQVASSEPQKGHTRGSCEGKVLSVTGGSIEVRSFGNILVGGAVPTKRDRQGETSIGNPITLYDLDLNTGIAREMMSGVMLRWAREEFTLTTAFGQTTTIRRADLPPRKFRVSEALAAGRYGGQSESQAYRLTDVRVGDEVDLELERLDGVWECTSIRIRRRPGGRIPPSREATSIQFPELAWHERMNAEQDWEEKGIPVPNKFAQLYLHDGTVTAIDEGSITLQRPDEAPRRFELSAALAAGRLFANPIGSKNPFRRISAVCFYRAADVRVGDRVVIHFGRVGVGVEQVDICETITITRRPGGRVPPAPEEGNYDYFPRHSEWMNALQDWEEKGIRPPEKYATDPYSNIGSPVEVIPRAKR